MQIERKFVPEGKDPFDMFDYHKVDVEIKDWSTGRVIFTASQVEMPKGWSKQACDIAISKYFRKAGVPTKLVKSREGNDGVPDWLLPSMAAPDSGHGRETSIKQVIGRIVGHWTYVGFDNGYFAPTEYQISRAINNHQTGKPRATTIATEENARSYYDQMVYLMLAQAGAPNSPQWFNTGLSWAYGIMGPAQGHWFVNLPHHKDKFDIPANSNDHPHQGGHPYEASLSAVGQHARPSPDAYGRVQAHACFILSLNDTMLGESGIYSWMAREARIFKYGSGSGVNISKLRGDMEKLSGGGHSSGSLSWMAIGDRSAGAIKSGGTTRRAAKMVCMDLNHPDIVKFINCKVEAELQVAAMHTGSKIITRHCQAIVDACIKYFDENLGHGHHEPLRQVGHIQALMKQAVTAGVPANYVDRAVELAEHGIKQWIGREIGLGYEEEAYATVAFQNANNSVRIPTDFYRAVDADRTWDLTMRTDGKTLRTVRAKDLERQIAEAAWFCGDPGVQFDTIINDWNVTPRDGRINASNPCSEHMRLDGSACNLASIRLTFFWNVLQKAFDWIGFGHVVRLWQITLDITNTMAHLPDKETAINSYLFRDTGLGFADLGSLLMYMGVAYDSDKGRAVAGAIASCMQAECHIASGEMARELGAYPRFAFNREDHLRIVKNHRAANNNSIQDIEGLEIMPAMLGSAVIYSAFGLKDGETIMSHLTKLWDRAVDLGTRFGFRNAEQTVIAPTGTIGFVMGCDTTGVEPMVALVVEKALAGGGTMTLSPKGSVEGALSMLGYGPKNMEYVTDPKTGRTVGLRFIGVADEHLPVFDTAFGDPITGRSIAWEGHVKMMAAVQTFISGAISKTVNMPHSATIYDIGKAYRMAHDLGVKAIAVYRDGCKLSQPLSLQFADQPDETSPEPSKIATQDLQTVEEMQAGITVLVKAAIKKGLTSPLNINVRVKPASIRVPGISLAVSLDSGTLYIHTARFDDGKLAEIWITYSGDQGIIQALIGQACRLCNVALQYGVPPEALLKTMVDSKFAPSGMTYGHPYIRTCTSLMNLAARLIAYHELGDHTVCNIDPTIGLDAKGQESVEKAIQDGTKLGLTVSMTGESCPHCNSVNYVTSGNGCKKCNDCGSAGGCG